MHLGLKIKVARVSKRLTQQDLADKINKTRPLVSYIEQTGKANYYTLRAICDALDLSFDDLEDDKSIVSESGINEIQPLVEELLQLRKDVSALRSLILEQGDLIRTIGESKSKDSPF